MSRKKRLFTLFLPLLLLALMLGACGGSETATDAVPTPPPYTPDPELAAAAESVSDDQDTWTPDLGDPEDGEEVFDEHCRECHSTDSPEIVVGPTLFEAGDRLLPKYVKVSVENPHDYQPLAEDEMPGDLPDRLTAQQINDVTAYVVSLRR